jgi:hypothetical protein
MTYATVLPDFVVIGAVKSATTWLHAQLQANPGIYLPDPEPHFFSREYQLGFEFYSHFFKSAGPGLLRGEKSADYLAHPLAPARLAEVLPNAPLVVQLRNPVERAYSDYKMLYRRGTIRKGPEAYLTSSSTEHRRFLDDGLYARHLRRWFKYFPQRAIKILLYEDVKTDPESTIRAVCRHIGAPEHYAPDLASQRYNDGSSKLLPLGMRRWLKPFKGVVKPLRTNPAFEKARNLLADEIAYPPLTAELRAWLVNFYASDVAELSDLIGRDLTAWGAATPSRLQELACR